MVGRKARYALILLFLSTLVARAQYDTTAVKRFTTAAVGAEVAALSGLYFLWFTDYPQSGFHFINDSRQWEQVDKLGHAFSTYQITHLTHYVYRHFGMDRKRAVFRSVLLSTSFITAVEVMDGFSAEWGFSISDFGANLSGVALFAGQSMLWDEQRIQLKFSYFPTDYAELRPNVLGSNAIESLLKDYNGQTYWLSSSPNRFGWESWPDWLMLSVGYGADGMIAGSRTDGNQLTYPNITRQRQVYLSLDVDLTQIKTRQKWLNAFFDALGVLKVPAPTLQWNSGTGTLRFYPIYF
jgi:hypothetical protein